MPNDTPIKKLCLINDDGTSEIRDVGALAENVIYDNTTSGLTATDTQAAIDELDERLDDIPDPMIFKGTLGTGGTITTLPAPSAANKGWTYKVITAGTYQSIVCKVGDVLTSNETEWVLIPSGDVDSDTWRGIKVNGTALLGSGISTGDVNFKNGTNTTVSGSGNDIAINSVNTTYSFTSGTNKFTVTPSGGTAQTVTVTPSITNNVTGSGTNGYIAKFNGANTITNGPAFGSDTTKYLRNDGSWVKPPNDNTTYTFATGDSNGTIKVTPSGGSAQNISVKGLGSAAYKNESGTWAINVSGSSASCTGNAATATKSTQDGSGNVITSTYVKKSGDAMTGNLTMADHHSLIFTRTWDDDPGKEYIGGYIMAGGSYVTRSQLDFVSTSGFYFKTGDSSTWITFSPGRGITYYEYMLKTNGTTLSLLGNNYLNLCADIAVQCRDLHDAYFVNINAANVSSSRRFKENIKSMTEEEAKKILNIRPVTFDFKEQYAKGRERYNQPGVIAEEVDEIIPSVVRYDNYDNPDEEPVPTFVEYSHFTPYLIKMIQMQEIKINEMQKQIDELKAQLGA